MQSTPTLIYRLLNKDYPESFSAYSPDKTDFHDLVCSILPQGWVLSRGDIWFYCAPPSHSVPLQGWKIHVSATLGNCRRVLKTILSVLLKYQDVSFKFALDRAVLSLINSKTWPRGGSGKFITIYPSSRVRFLELLKELDAATTGFLGPYILSDQRYKLSRVVFYRYGGMRSHSVLEVTGERIPVLRRPDGQAEPDKRLAYPVLPSWEEPIAPAGDNSPADNDNPRLLHNRYAIETAVSFSSAGGVYIARDQKTGNKVVVKEARPLIQSGEDHDAVTLLKKEHRLLTVLADTGMAPQPIDLFQEWEHWFLVEEFLEGVSIGQHAAASSLLLRTRTTLAERNQWSERFSRIGSELVRVLGVLHSHGIVFGDLSTTNIIITPSGNELKIIDFEGAHQVGVDQPADIYTPGFLSEHRLKGGHARPEDDYYAAGAVLLACLLPINGLIHLNPNAHQKFLAAISSDLSVPQNVPKLIDKLMDTSHSSSEPVLSISEPLSVQTNSGYHQDTALGYEFVVEDIARHLNGVASYSRNDRLYPADPKVFSTNPLSLAYGAVGVAYALRKISGHVPSPAVDWIFQRQIDPAAYPPGLYVGMSGIAWSLLEMGFVDKAEGTFQSACDHPLLFKTADVFHGVAGWGMTALRFFEATANEFYLVQARRAGESLLASRQQSDRGFHWNSGERPVGLAHGSSGVALFLLYLYLATRDQRYLSAGLKALNFDLASGVLTRDGGLSWGRSADATSILYPFWRFGSAGIGIVVARYYSVLKLPRLRAILEKIYIDADRKFAVFPGQFCGLAGIGEFLLDLHDMTGEQRFLESARRIADGILLFRVEREGSAFPGETASRLCCDYGTGSAGIGLFLNRLLGRQGSDFLTDFLLPNWHWKGEQDEIPEADLEFAAITQEV